MNRWGNSSKLFLLIAALLVIIAIATVIHASGSVNGSSDVESDNATLQAQQIVSITSNAQVFKTLNENDANNREAIFDMYSPVALSKQNLTFTFNEVCGKVIDYQLTINSTCYNIIPHYNYTSSESCINNTVNNTVDCTNNTVATLDYIENDSYPCWKNVDAIPAGDNNYKIDANVAMAKCENGNLGYQIDWIPSIDLGAGKTFAMNDWSWWNFSYWYRMDINVSSLSLIPYFYVNGTNGVSINGTIIYPIASTTIGNVSLYYNNATNYAIIENDTYIQTVSLSSYNGLLAYYKADENASFQNLTDALGNYNFTQNGNPSSLQGVISGSRNINMTGTQYFSRDNGFLNFPNNFTVNFWVMRLESETNKYLITSSLTTGSNNQGWRIYFDSTTSNVIDFQGIGSDTNIYSVSTTQPINQNQWTMITAVKNSTNIVLYVNGTYNSGSTYTQTGNWWSSTTACIGGIYLSGSFVNVIGVDNLDEIRIWNRSLSASEISQLYNNYQSVSGYGNIYLTENYASYLTSKTQGDASILQGVQNSVIGSSYTPYQNQMLYERLIVNGSQYLGTFDWFITSGNKRYAFFYDQNNSANLPVFYNISPVLYVWENYNMTQAGITQSVQALINSTYSS